MDIGERLTASVSVGVARSHAYWFSDYLARTQQLRWCYIGIPRMLVDPHLRPLARTFPWVHMSVEALSRARMGRLAQRLRWPAAESYDRWVGRHMEPCDVFMALSGQGLYARRAARQLGALTVCDRGSTHIEEQDALLAEEHALNGFPYVPIEPRYVAKECAEYEESDLIVVQSSFAHRSFLGRGVAPEKLAMVPLGAALDRFRPIGKRDGTFRVLFVGQMSLRKGVRYLLEAVARLRIQAFEVVLIGPRAPETEALLRRYNGSARYLGPISKAQLPWHYSQASVFVLPTIEDGFGLVLAEALACGVPVITTPHSGGPELVSDGREGYIVPIRDPVAIRERILTLYEEPQLRDEMAHAALTRARTFGGWDRYGTAVVDVYRRALGIRKMAGSERTEASGI